MIWNTNGHFADNIFKCIHVNANDRIVNMIPPRFVPKRPINITLSLILIAQCRKVNQPFSVSESYSLRRSNFRHLHKICSEPFIDICRWFNSSRPSNAHIRWWTRPSFSGHYLNQCCSIVNWALGTNLTEIWIKIQSVPYKKMCLKRPCANCSHRPLLQCVLRPISYHNQPDVPTDVYMF